MIRKYINSKVILIKGVSIIEEKIIEDIINNKFIIQVEPQMDNLIVEYCESAQMVDLIPFTSNMSTPRQEPQGDLHKVEEYREVVINNDPFGKYSGYAIGDIFDAQDINWINRCIKDMRNDYIKSRVEYLKDHYKKVGAQWIK